jgi:hypothetical protein
MVDLSTDAVGSTEEDKRYARQLLLLTIGWLVLVIGAGIVLMYFV